MRVDAHGLVCWPLRQYLLMRGLSRRPVRQLGGCCGLRGYGSLAASFVSIQAGGLQGGKGGSLVRLRQWPCLRSSGAHPCFASRCTRVSVESARRAWPCALQAPHVRCKPRAEAHSKVLKPQKP